jgi:hypothetical protein
MTDLVPGGLFHAIDTGFHAFNHNSVTRQMLERSLTAGGRSGRDIRLVPSFVRQAHAQRPLRGRRHATLRAPGKVADGVLGRWCRPLQAGAFDTVCNGGTSWAKSGSWQSLNAYLQPRCGLAVGQCEA